MKVLKIQLVLGEVLLLFLVHWPSTSSAAENNPIKSMVDALGPFPILQMGAAIILVMVTGIGSLLFLKGSKFNRSNEPSLQPQNSPALEVYFNGPLKAIFETLTDIKGRQLVARMELKEDFASLLSQSRNKITDVLEDVHEDILSKMESAIRDNEAAMENRFRDLNGNINSLHNRVDEMLKSLARLEAIQQHETPVPRSRR